MDYRCYHVDGEGHILAVETFKVASDAAACERAQLIAMNLAWRSHELWQLARQIS